MPYQMQIKAVERQLNFHKISATLFRNTAAMGATIASNFLGVGTTIPLAVIGLAAYLM